MVPKEKGLPIAEGYSVAPHHAGVYPVVPHLYRAWKSVWGINLTTTEGYPDLLPVYNRMGFKTLGIQVGLTFNTHLSAKPVQLGDGTRKQKK